MNYNLTNLRLKFCETGGVENEGVGTVILSQGGRTFYLTRYLIAWRKLACGSIKSSTPLLFDPRSSVVVGIFIQ
jgi:hypothetical protein